MKRKLLIAWIGSLAASALAVSAQATMVAGWDFSQYFGDGILSTDGATFTNTLNANYSDLDPTNNAGAESAQYGTLYLNGQFGSTAVPVGSGNEQILPTDGSLVSNLNAPGGGAGQPFDSLTILASEGQQFTNTLAMIASAAVSVVFEADLTSVPPFGTDWSISFGGKTSSGTQAVGIEFSTDGSAYSSFGSVNLNTTDSPFSVNLGAAGADQAFVRLTFSPAAGSQSRPIIDNLAINATVVPEPATALLCGLGLVGLAISGRRRGVARS